MPIYAEMSSGTRIELDEETAAGIVRQIEATGDLPSAAFGRLGGNTGPLVRTADIVAVIAIQPDIPTPPSTDGMTWMLNACRQDARLLTRDDLEGLPSSRGEEAST